MIHQEARVGKTTRVWHEQLSNIGKCEIGEGCVIHSNVWIGDGVIIGNNCKIEAFVFIPPGVELEDNVFVGPHTCFTNDVRPPSGKWSKTIVRKGAKFGANCSILAGVEVGENAMIGMGAVVLKNIPARETWVGNPARRIK